MRPIALLLTLAACDGAGSVRVDEGDLADRVAALEQANAALVARVGMLEAANTDLQAQIATLGDDVANVGGPRVLAEVDCATAELVPLAGQASVAVDFGVGLSLVGVWMKEQGGPWRLELLDAGGINGTLSKTGLDCTEDDGVTRLDRRYTVQVF